MVGLKRGSGYGNSWHGRGGSEITIAGMGGVGEPRGEEFRTEGYGAVVGLGWAVSVSPVGKSLELKVTERSLVVMAILQAETCWLTSRHGGYQPTAASLPVRGPNIAPLYARWSDSESMSMGVVET